VLTILVMNGSRRSTNSWIKNVGTGSSEQDLTGTDISSRRTSFSVHGRKHASDDDADTDTGGGDRPAVLAQTVSTLRAKNTAKPLAVWSVAVDTSRSHPSRDDSERHNNADERPLRASR